MRVQRGENTVHAVGVVVVQQQAHAHAALGGLMQLLQQLLACGVVVPDVVLRVDGHAGVVNQAGAQGVGLVGLVDDVGVGVEDGLGLRFGLGFLRGGRGVEVAVGRQVEGVFQLGAVDGGDVDGWLALVEIGQGLAGGEHGDEQQKGGCGAHKRQPEKGLEMARIVTKGQPENGVSGCRWSGRLVTYFAQNPSR